MQSNLFTPSTMPVSKPPDPLLLFIQRAQLELCYREDHSSGGGQPVNKPGSN